VTAAAVLALCAAGAAGAVGGGDRVAGGPERDVPHKITIESWLTATPAPTGLAGTVNACFKLRAGSLSDRGGRPEWTYAASYADESTPRAQCGRPEPVGAFMLHAPRGSATVYAAHTMTGRRGQIHIHFSGVYDLATTFQGSGTWVITGGTGAYRGLQGEGTWVADASAFPHIRHTETGTVTWRR
jgi:hypothetical protein